MLRDINSMSKGNASTKTGVTLYHALLGLPDKGYAIKGLIVYFSWDVNAFRPTKRFSFMLLSNVL